MFPILQHGNYDMKNACPPCKLIIWPFFHLMTSANKQDYESQLLVPIVVWIWQEIGSI